MHIFGHLFPKLGDKEREGECEVSFGEFWVEKLERKGRRKKEGKKKKEKGKEKEKKKGRGNREPREEAAAEEEEGEAVVHRRSPPSTVGAAAIHSRFCHGELSNLEFRIDSDFDLKNTF